MGATIRDLSLRKSYSNEWLFSYIIVPFWIQIFFQNVSIGFHHFLIHYIFWDLHKMYLIENYYSLANGEKIILHVGRYRESQKLYLYAASEDLPVYVENPQ